ncbi:chitobiase/beta-hexosaminidase C-terminal domain-containing protein [Verrucomicrobiaceae bacterium 227]
MKNHLKFVPLPAIGMFLIPLLSSTLHAGLTKVTETGLGGDTAAIVATDFGEDSLTFSDRTHEHNGAAFSGTVLNTGGALVVPLPAYLLGGDYVRFANNARENNPYRAEVVADVSSDFYLLVDNRLDGPGGTTGSPNTTDPVPGGPLQWILDDGWVRVNTGISPGGLPDYTGVDESGNGVGAGQGLNQFYAVYRLSGFTTVTLGACGIGGGNMFSLVVVPTEGGGPDSDEDGLPDVWEIASFGHLDEDDSGDFDDDGLSNLEEFNVGSDPSGRDSDDDGLDDGAEVNLYATDPIDEDSDDDGLTDGEEIQSYSTDPNDFDSDDDSLSDGSEVSRHKTNPNLADSDRDGFNDAVEISSGSDPNDDQSIPDFSDLDDVVINEFMASNGGTLPDEDGDSSDWIELWNPENVAIEITGWFLSDDPLNLSKWTFPGHTLSPKGFLLVFASGKDRVVPGAEFHTNFQLGKAAGSFLALSRPDGSGGVEVVSVFDPYGEQHEDVSFGFYGESEPLPGGYFLSPTPGAANSQEAVGGFVEDTNFTVDRGFYDAAFEVVVSSATPGASIIYTTDGTTPNENPLNGTRIDAADANTGPSAAVTISTTTNLRAMAVKSGFEPTDVDTHTYIFRAAVLQQSNASVPAHAAWGHAGPDFEMDPDIVNHADPEVRPDAGDFLRVPTLSLTMNWEDMFGSNGIYIRGESVEKVTSIEYLNPDGSLTAPNLKKGFQVDGTVQITGGSSTGRWKSDKLSMRLKFSPDLRFPVFGEDRTDRFDTLVIDNRLNNVWHYNPGSGAGPGQAARAQYTHDQFPADLHNLMGGLSPEGRHCLLYINGVLWGVTELHERPDDNFAAEYLGGDNSEYDAMKHRTSTVVAGTSAAYLAMLNLTRANMGVQANYVAVEEVLDIENFMAYMIANYYVGNTDWAHQNWYATFGRDRPDGKWFYHSWDPEHCMESTTTNNTGKNDTGGPTEVFRNLIANSEFRMRFADTVHRHFDNGGVLTPAKVAGAYLRRADAVDFVTRLESARWGDNGDTVVNNPYSRLDWLRVRNQLLGTVGGGAWGNYFPARTGIVLNQFKNVGWYPDTDAPDFHEHGGNVSANFPLTMTKNGGGIIYYTTDGSDPRVPVTGGVAPTASAYSNAITLTESGPIRARVLKGGEWSAVTGASFIVDALPADSSNLVISEINYHPGAPTDAEIAAGFSDRSDFEFIEVRNIHPTRSIDLSGVSFEAGIDFEMDSDSSINELASGESLLLVKNQAAFEFRYGFGLPIAGSFQNGTQLANGGELLAILGPGFSTIRSFTYDDDFPWPVAPDGAGLTLTLINPASNPDHTRATSWRASVLPNGSAGTSDASTFDRWADSFGRGLVPGGNEDLDDYANILEYALGRSPLEKDDPASVLVWSPDFSTVKFQKMKAADDVILIAQFSQNLDSWETAEILAVRDNGDGSETLTVHPPATIPLSARMFVRLRAVLVE